MGAVERQAVEKIRTKFSEGAIVELAEFRDELTLVVDKSLIVQLSEFLRDEPGLEYEFLSSICGVDRSRLPADKADAGSVPGDRFEVVYHLYSIRRKSRLRLKVRVPESSPFVNTVSGVWPSANWHEREVYDMYGVEFSGHPDLRRILNPDDFRGFPFRKDFPIQ